MQPSSSSVYLDYPGQQLLKQIEESETRKITTLEIRIGKETISNKITIRQINQQANKLSRDSTDSENQVQIIFR